MKKIYHLSTCSTCKRIIKDVKFTNEFIFQDIKFEKLTENQLIEMHKLSGSYEVLFSKRARNYSILGLANKELKENDYKELILADYTFLKRPIVIINKKIFIGNSKSTVEEFKQLM